MSGPWMRGVGGAGHKKIVCLPAAPSTGRGHHEHGAGCLRLESGRTFSADISLVEQVSPRDVVHAYSVTPAAAPRFRGDNRSA